MTIIPEDRGSFELFSVACSSEEHISGFDVINGADVAHLCRHHDCKITFGWQEIPNTLRPQHDTNHGDGFQVLIRNSPSQLASRIEDGKLVPPSATAASSSSVNRTVGDSSAADTDGSIMPSAPTSESSSQAATRFMTALHLFQLEGHEVVMQLVNAQLVQPSHEMAVALNVPLNCLEAVYPIPARLMDFPEMAIPAIVQRTGEFPRAPLTD